jgi:hypothetical protein
MLWTTAYSTQSPSTTKHCTTGERASRSQLLEPLLVQCCSACRETDRPAAPQKKNPPWCLPAQPRLMTETTQKSNEASSSSMTTSQDAGQGKEGAAIALTSGSPPNDKRSSAPESETPTKSSKKRRKVNHGKPLMPCTHIPLDSPANSRNYVACIYCRRSVSRSRLPQHPIFGFILRSERFTMIANLTSISI